MKVVCDRQAASLRIAGLTIALAGLWAIDAQDPSEEVLSVVQLKDDLYLIEGTSNGSSDAGNMLIYTTSEGVILVDDRFDRNYKGILSAVSGITDLPVRYVVNTHHHGDHTGSNVEFVKSAEIVIQAKARQHMVDGDQAGIPRTTYTDQASVFLGGKEVRMYHFGRGHTDGDVTVYLPAHRTVHMGDLLAGTRGVTNPVMDYDSGGSILEWPETLDQTLALDIDLVIPGHGDPTDKAGLQAHREKVATIRERVSGMVKAHRTKEEITEVLLAEFDYKPINLRSLDGMMAELGQ